MRSCKCPGHVSFRCIDSPYAYSRAHGAARVASFQGVGPDHLQKEWGCLVDENFGSQEICQCLEIYFGRSRARANKLKFIQLAHSIFKCSYKNIPTSADGVTHYSCSLVETTFAYTNCDTNPSFGRAVAISFAGDVCRLGVLESRPAWPAGPTPPSL